MAVLFQGSEFLSATATYTLTSVGTVTMWVSASTIAAVIRAFGYDTFWEARTDALGTMLDEFLQSGTVPSFAMSVDVLYAMAFTFDSVTPLQEMFVDGVSVGTNAAAGAPAATGTISIGQRTGAAAGDAWQGVMEDVRVYNRILTPAEIATIHATRGVDGIVDGLLHRWPLNEGAEGAAVTAAIDVAGTMDMTTITGTPTYNASALRFRRRAA